MENKNAKNNTKTNMKIDTIKFKDITIIAFLAFLALVVVYSLFWGPAKKFGDSLMPTRTFSVSAEGKVTVSPDIAKISFSVVSEGADPRIIAEENNKTMNSIISFVKSQGVEDKDIKTTQYNLVPKYQTPQCKEQFCFPFPPTTIVGYTLTQTVFVKIRDLNKVSEILAGLPELGVNKIDSISFDIDDLEKYLAEARNQAFEKVKEKAESMAVKNGVKLGKVISFSEYQGYIPYRTEKALGMGGADTTLTPPQIQPGSQEVTLQVNVSYEIR